MKSSISLIAAALLLLCSGCIIPYQASDGTTHTITWPAPSAYSLICVDDGPKLFVRVYIQDDSGELRCLPDISREPFILPPSSMRSKEPNQRIIRLSWYDFGDCCNRQVTLVAWPYDPKTGEIFGRRQSITITLPQQCGPFIQEVHFQPSCDP